MRVFSAGVLDDGYGLVTVSGCLPCRNCLSKSVSTSSQLWEQVMQRSTRNRCEW